METKDIQKNVCDTTCTIRMPVDIIENSEGYTLTADMPGVGKENVDITFENNELVIFGKVQDSETKGTPLYSDFSLGNYRRSFVIGEGVDPSSIKANFDNGVLTLSIPKSEKRKPRKIEISAA